MRCLACGSEWLDMGARRAPGAATVIVDDSSSAGARTGDRRIRVADAMVWASAAFAILVAAAWPLAHLAAWGNPDLEFSSLSARQLVRDGQIAVRIEGRITNRGAVRRAMPAVDVVLTGVDGRVYGWTHRPAVPWLEPGESIRFATANGSIPRTADRAAVSSAGVTAEVKL